VPGSNRQDRADFLEKNTLPIRIVPRRKRQLWEDSKSHSVHADRPPKHGDKWSEEDILRIVLAKPGTDTYQDLAKELGRSDGAVRRMRVWASHILKGEYADRWLAWVESSDPKTRANKHDVILIYKVLKEAGYLDLSVTEQFRLAQPLPQPRGGWRGDRTGEASRRRRKEFLKLQALVGQVQKEGTDGDRGV
jgi:hypothetical protein